MNWENLISVISFIWNKFSKILEILSAIMLFIPFCFAYLLYPSKLFPDDPDSFDEEKIMNYFFNNEKE